MISLVLIDVIPDSKREKPASPIPSQWPFRALFVLSGLAAIFVGLEAIAHGFWWIHAYNPRFGVIGTGPMLMFVFMGILFVVLGLIPWRREQKSKSKDDIYKVP